jgi:hypothetical protein
MPPPSPLVRNERIKLTAAWFNTIGAAAIAAGVIAPVVASVGVPGYAVGWALIAVSLIWLFAAWDYISLAERYSRA